jgi:8-oxo-dGTP pyrophosphatase MutT (NUDIX family)
MKTFKNRKNIEHKTKDGKSVWESRSVATAGTIMIKMDDQIFVCVGKRGPAAADFIGKWNLVCGYLDWDETASEACEREIHEEVGLDLDLMRKFCLVNHLDYPWRIHDNPKQANRQNITLHFGCISVVDKFPELTLEYNEVDGEIEEALWISLDSVDDYDWAFDHDNIIKLFAKKFIK